MAVDGWRKVEAKDWTSGFFPGALWLMGKGTLLRHLGRMDWTMQAALTL